MLKLKLKDDANGLRIRETPINGKPIGQLHLGQTIESQEDDATTQAKIGVDGEWIKIKTDDGVVGYTAAWMLDYETPPEKPSTPAPKTDTQTTIIAPPVVNEITVQATSNTPLYESPPVVLMDVSQNDSFISLEDATTTNSKVGKAGEWLKVRTADGTEGYISGDSLQLATSAPSDSADDDDTTVIIPPIDDSTDDDPTVIVPSNNDDDSATSDTDTSEGIPLHPTIKALKLRAEPVDGEQVGLLSSRDVVFSLEDDVTTLEKLGEEGEWLKVKTLYEQEAYTAAWYLEKHTGAIPEVVTVDSLLSGLKNVTGMNLDIYHPLGSPDPARLQGMGWVRFLFNVSYDPNKQGDARYGNLDVDAAFNRYKPHLEKYAKAGFKILLVFTHQTYGEGRNEYWPWNTMTTSKWQRLTAKFTEMMHDIATKFKGTGLVHAYQVWNEMDAHIGAVASVPMVASDYAIILGETIKIIKAVDPSALVITGGHTGGPVKGANYARDTLNALPAGIEPDGIAFHPYGRGVVSAPKEPYSIFGSIDESMRQYGAVLPHKPLWMTEWGVLDRSGDKSADILQYASEMVTHLKTNYSGKIAATMWYAWAMGMHNGYGLVKENDQAIEPFNDGFRKL